MGEGIKRSLGTKNTHLPLYVDGEVKLGQSTVILRYLGKKYGLWSDDFKEELRLEQVILIFCIIFIFIIFFS